MNIAGYATLKFTFGENVDYAYDKDPNKYKGAKPIKTMGWDEMIKLVGKKWRPGMNTPFDPVASREAKKFGLKVVIANGRKFANLERILDGKTFTGTVIE